MAAFNDEIKPISKNKRILKREVIKMIKKVDHITFAVKSLEETGKRIKEVYGAEFIMNVENKEGKYICDMYSIGGDLIIGLLESTSPDGFVAKHLERCGESLQHIGVDVEDLGESLKRFEAAGIKYSNYSEIAGIRKEVLVSAKNGFGSILQIMEWLGDFKNANSVNRMRMAWTNK